MKRQNRRSETGPYPVVFFIALLAGGPALARQEAPEQPDSLPADVVAQAKGQAALEEGRAHLRSHQWAQAIAAFNQALNYLPGNQEATEGIARARQALDQAPLIEGVAEELAVQLGRARAEFDASMAQAEVLRSQQDFAGAERSALTAQIRLRQARQLFSEREYGELSRRTETLLARIDREREEYRLTEEAEKQAEAIEQQADVREREREARQRLINSNLERVRQLQAELKYGEALQVIDEILFIDELNPAAQALRDIIRTTMIYRRYAEIQRQKEDGIAWLALEGQKQLIPPRPNISGPGDKSLNAIITYPEDWPSLSLRRISDLGLMESPGNRQVSRMLSQTRLPVVDFAGNPLEAVVRYLGTVSGQNIYVDWKALGFIGVDPSDPVTLQLSDVSLETVLDRVLDQVGDGYDRPEWSIQDGIVNVSSEEALRKNTVTVVYDIRDLLFDVPHFGEAPSMGLSEALAQGVPAAGLGGGGLGGGATFGGRSGGNAVFSDPGEQAPRPSREEIVDQLVSLIQDTVDPDGWRDLGGDTGSLQELNGNLIITNTLRNHRQIEGLLSQLREIRAIQIGVDARLMAVTTNWFEQIGVDLDLYFNTNNTLRQQQLAVDPLGHLSDFFNGDGTLKDPLIYTGINQLPTPLLPPFTNQNNFGGAFGVPQDTNLDGIPDTITYGVGPVGQPLRTTQGFAPIGFVQDSLGLIDTIADPSDFASAIMGANPALAVGIQFLDDVQVDLLIEATQADRRSVILNAPRLTLFNGQRAWVAVARQVAYVSALVPVTGDASGAFQPIPGVVNDGVVLDIEAVVSADRRYVTMTTIVQISDIIQIRQLETQGAAGGGGGVGGGGDAATFTSVIELPEIRVALVNTSVSIPDKGTVLLGGLRQVEEVEVETGVPILSKIPFISRFFTNRLTDKQEETLLILIRPEIIIQQENEDMLFPGLSDTLGGAGSYFQ